MHAFENFLVSLWRHLLLDFFSMACALPRNRRNFTLSRERGRGACTRPLFSAQTMNTIPLGRASVRQDWWLKRIHSVFQPSVRITRRI